MLKVKNWSTFQHYNSRRPPWIKLHRAVLENKEWHKLSYASRALAISIWLLASEHKDTGSGLVTDDYEELAFRARMKDTDVVESVKELIKHGFIEHITQTEMALLAPCYQPATPESEAETKGETEDDEDSAESVFKLGERIAEAVGWKDDPRWMGNYSRLAAWLAAGCDFEKDILPTIKTVMSKKRGDRPKSLNYFESAIADAYATRTTPMEKGTPNATNRKDARKDGKSERAKQAILDGLNIGADSSE